MGGRDELKEANRAGVYGCDRGLTAYQIELWWGVVARFGHKGPVATTPTLAYIKDP